MDESGNQMTSVGTAERKLESAGDGHHPGPLAVRLDRLDAGDVDRITAMNLSEPRAEAGHRGAQRRPDRILRVAGSDPDVIAIRLDPIDRVGPDGPESGSDGQEQGRGDPRAGRHEQDVVRTGPYETGGASVPNPADVDPTAPEIRARRGLARASVGLLLGFGAARLEQVVATLDRWRERDGRGGDVAAALIAPPQADRVNVALWGTHGALPPRMSDVVVLRGLCAASAAEAAVLLGITEARVEQLVARAARRVRALGLDVRPVGPQEAGLGLRVAEQRIRALTRRLARIVDPPLVAVGNALAEWCELVAAVRSRPRARDRIA